MKEFRICDNQILYLIKDCYEFLSRSSPGVFKGAYSPEDCIAYMPESPMSDLGMKCHKQWKTLQVLTITLSCNS